MTDPWAFQRWAFNTPTGSPGKKAVLMALAGMADKTSGRCEALQETLAIGVEMSGRSVRRHLLDLEKQSIVARRRQHRIDGRRRGDEYLLLAPWVTEWPDGELPDNLSGRPPANIDSDHRPPVSGPLTVGVEIGVGGENNHSGNNHAGEPAGGTFEAWLEHHCQVTGSRVMAKPGTRAYQKAEAAFKAAKREYPDEDLRLISTAAMANRHRRENGYTTPESVLRPNAVPKLLEDAKRNRGEKDLRSSGATADFGWDGDGLAERTRQEAAARRAEAGDDNDGPEVGF